MKRKHLFVIGLIASMALPLLSGCRNEPESQINIKTEESDAAQGENEVVNLTFLLLWMSIPTEVFIIERLFSSLMRSMMASV